MSASTMNLLLLALMLVIIATFQVGVDALPINNCNVFQGNLIGLVPINANAANTCSNSDWAG